MSLGFSVLLWLHIVSVVGWLGSIMVFGMLIGPTLPALSPTSRNELIVKLVPRYVRYGQVFALITPIFGLSLALYISHGSFRIFTPNNVFSEFIAIGALLSLVGWAITFSVLTPAAGKLVRLTKESMSGEGAPSPELLKASKTMRISSAAGMVVLLAIVACMVYAATA